MKKVNYKIRELEKEDLSPERGFLETLKNLTEVGNLSKKQLENIFNKIKKQNSHVFIAVTDNGQIIGTLTLLLEQKFTHNGSLAGHIEELVTRKEFENIGVASSLIKEAIKKAKQAKCYKIVLDCKDELIPFYKRFGFKEFQNCMRIDL